MHIVFFTHPNFQTHQSMPRYASWLLQGMKERGHTVELWTAEAQFFKMPVPAPLKKWMSYIDQFIVFPRQVKQKIKKIDADTLFVVTDHALGPWVPLIKNRKHLIHCHDFLAQKSAFGGIEQNPTSWTGKKYQAYIRNGYTKGKNFISISHKTEEDLLSFLPATPALSTVVYNAVNPIYRQQDKTPALQLLQTTLNVELSQGFILHVGGNQWYKNKLGIILLYNAWRSKYLHPLPLLLIGERPDALLEEAIQNSPFRNNIYAFSGLTDDHIIAAYSTATLFLFPSLAEGFGWPIAEAMACGCPVITTNEAPMTEVGGDAAFYISKMPVKGEQIKEWLKTSAAVVEQTIQLMETEKKQVQLKGLENIKRFNSETQLSKIAAVYEQL